MAVVSIICAKIFVVALELNEVHPVTGRLGCTRGSDPLC